MMTDFEALLLANLNHQWQSTKKIAANIPSRAINQRSLISKCWYHLDRMKKTGIVEM